jgi:hypothetical protein
MGTWSPTCWCRSCRARRRRPYVIALLALIIAAGSYIHAHPQPGRAQPDQTPTAGTARPTAQPQQPAVAVPATATAGQDVSWVSFHGMQLPVSATAGPRDTTGGLASGFTDTPRGRCWPRSTSGSAPLPSGARRYSSPRSPARSPAPTPPRCCMPRKPPTPSSARQLRLARASPLARGYAAEVGYRFLAWSPSSAVDVLRRWRRHRYGRGRAAPGRGPARRPRPGYWCRAWHRGA